MAPSNPELWNKLHAYEFDQPDAAFPFSARLARENGWSQAFANRVIDEYRRFLYLAATSDTPMTPSDEVDQVWHLHLAYSRDYWGHLCAEVLERPLHHGPTRGGNEEAEKYLEWYEKTKARYAEELGAPPPKDIWPPAHIRFDLSRTYQRIDTSGVWLIRQPAVSAFLIRNIAIVAGFALVTSTAYAADAEKLKPVLDTIATYSFFEILIYGFMAVSVIQYLYLKLMKYITGYDSKRDPGGCSAAGCGGGGCGGCGG